MIIPVISEKNLRLLLARLNECSFDLYTLVKVGSKWNIIASDCDRKYPRNVTSATLTTREAIIALCVVLDTMTSIRDKAYQDGYDSAIMDAGTPNRDERT